MAAVRIVRFESRHAADFRQLNLDWILEHWEVEEADRRVLDAPEQNVIATGGAIFMAELGSASIGCCGLLRHADGVFEVTKMAVHRKHRGSGVGRALIEHVIEYARALGLPNLVIVSNTILEPAIRLYRRVGFVQVPLTETEYARGNIMLELRLAKGAG